MGAMIWYLSPILAGEVEPWDSPTHYYPASLFSCGFILACISRRHLWIAPIGIGIGQVVYIFATTEIGPLWPVGMAVLSVYSIFAIAGALAASVCCETPADLLRRRKDNRSPHH